MHKHYERRKSPTEMDIHEYVNANMDFQFNRSHAFILRLVFPIGNHKYSNTICKPCCLLPRCGALCIPLYRSPKWSTLCK